MLLLICATLAALISLVYASRETLRNIRSYERNQS